MNTKRFAACASGSQDDTQKRLKGAITARWLPRKRASHTIPGSSGSIVVIVTVNYKSLFLVAGELSSESMRGGEGAIEKADGDSVYCVCGTASDQ